MKYLIFFVLPLYFFGGINFLHINKTGGTTLRALIREHFDPSDCYPHTKIGVFWEAMYTRKGQEWEIVPMHGILEKFPSAANKVVMGHFPVWFLENKDPDFFSTSFNFTILREPVDRVLSQYFYLKKLSHPIGNPVRSPLDVPSNHMCMMLCSDNTLTGEALLQNAIRNLERMDCIIFQDDFETGVRRLFEQLGFDFAGDIPKLNETARAHTFDEKILSKIRKKNDLDIRLYEHASRFLRNQRD